MNVNDIGWTGSEKKVARRAFDAALEVALGKVMAELKSKAGAVTTPADMWEIEDYLRQQRRKIDRMFDYRYSQLTVVFAVLIREGYLDENQLSGLAEDKRQEIRRFLAWHAKE
ncbi:MULTISPECIES: hypothetical protein [unclassified Mesorhizobium]|uniref:hypothetical protein n=1 Tax=unclassified Mesorhizobium TaxID=325217 RepID=UPI000FCB4CDC|nr:MULTISPECIES: hypothetical protein [unclassified Mesorhizobium]TGP20035.1 hypothetical protein EN874_027000 [Mesorhizobium sp. M1D.F.Ca.ET.231.01.1.1]TGP27407.1 hypothetical protein EN877_26285 [Mesorhizobium sp. M1D.F.Ca.ET.234.01.1.1]TGS41442.1 hypothetical protein EN827_25370 [Mesorhizobium sp. M1D.F.Ca.ET.184.01.1.1]TGS59203.1 hypothetical protein EN826_025370 [Mesorhizobium sp. M1D.F.Ca.ET.183.01.1.1]